ncbi:papain-like cysteine protease family protein [Roseomonas rosulenta]|uniref:papain-like cysteine protease family protein n=1 Tax=Roseomonas rosulenta TaxID=2748667 RepID=UPI0018DFF79D|nr:papain-like cysteine protease family protein [Roseomonas rosulenta]
MYLDVPFVSQLDFGGNLHLDDPTGCWYATACMIGYSFEQGPRQGVPALYSRPLPQADGTVRMGHWTISKGWLPTLMQNEHLVELEGGLSATLEELEVELLLWGPLFLPWLKTSAGSTYGHASAIIGTGSGGIIYHDPENAPRSELPLEEMRAKLAAGWPLLRRDALPFSYGVSVRN